MQRLTEVEAMNQECLNEMRATISELECANGMKDAEIRSLHELLKSLTYKDAWQSGHRLNSTMSLSEKNGMIRGHRRTPSFLSVHQRAQSVSSIPSRINSSSLKHKPSIDASHAAVTIEKSIIQEEPISTNVVEMDKASPLEEKFRRDIDTLLEENLAFLMKFSMLFQQIQGFQTKYDQLQAEISKLNPNKDHANDQPAKLEMEAIEKRLRELKIELQVWLEQNAMFKGELQCKFDSLCSIQAEIEGTMEMGADTEDGARFTSYHVAKFQGEILNMKQENNKVADELQAGLDHVKWLQKEIEKVLAKILSTSLSGPKSSTTWRNAPSKSKVPLRMFLFPAKKKKPSLFACVNPAHLSKQNSDMAFFTKMS
jgi:predicted  nucleic acid-binding Zn-ribbon protein